MKYIALMALFGAVQSYKLGYDESEGPTKTDNGENDDFVTLREQDIKNGKKESGWTNPLGWSDAGDDDDTVLAQLNMQSHHHHKKHHNRLVQKNSRQQDAYDGDSNTVSPYDGMEKHKTNDFSWPYDVVQVRSFGHQQDEYDEDHNTVSPYDGDVKHQKFDFGVPPPPEEFEGAMVHHHKKHHAKHHNLSQKVNQMKVKSRDEYDGDTNTVSPYDAMEKHEKWDFGVAKG